MTPEEVLLHCIQLQKDKAADYNKGSVKRRDYFRNGLSSVHDLIHMKTLRAQSIIESKSANPNFESLKDSYMDLINYCSFAIALMDNDL